MELSVKERLVLSMILEPQAGRYDALKMLRKFREELSFSEDEIKAINLHPEEGLGYKWEPKNEKPKDIEVNDVMLNIIKKQFQKLDKEERLHESHFDLYEKFMAM